MVYNKTKRGLEKGATILGIVLSSIQMIGALVMFILGCIYIGGYSEYYYGYGWIYYSSAWATPVLVMGILLIAFSITTLALNANLVKDPVNPDGTLKNRNGQRIALVIFSFLAGQLITFGLEIAVLCLKDFTDEQAVTATPAAQPVAPVAAQPVVSSANTTVSVKEMSVEAKIAELKHFKELGILDETAYNKAIEKIINDLK